MGKRSAFTLIELLVVIAIILVVSYSVFLVIYTCRTRTKRAAT